MRRLQVHADGIIIFFPDSLKGQACLLVDEVIAVTFAVCSVKYIIIFAVFSPYIRVFQGFLFILADTVGCLDEIVMPDRLDP